MSGVDDYASAAKPVIDWDAPAARERLVDSAAKDPRACLAVLDGREVDPVVEQAGRLLATVTPTTGGSSNTCLSMAGGSRHGCTARVPTAENFVMWRPPAV